MQTDKANRVPGKKKGEGSYAIAQNRLCFSRSHLIG
jgi:hypothetical protein